MLILAKFGAPHDQAVIIDTDIKARYRLFTRDIYPPPIRANDSRFIGTYELPLNVHGISRLGLCHRS